MKIRNYSFKDSRRLPQEKMTEVNGIKIPSMPGSCYHAIMSTLAESKDQFCPWTKIREKTEKFMRQYGGDQVWDKFVSKRMSKTDQQRIKDNTHTLTRSGRDCYGYRLHEQGMVIYFFKDGAILFTGGTFTPATKGKYNVIFPDGKGLQVRYRGTIMTWKEYVRFLAAKCIDPSGAVLDANMIKTLRTKSLESVTVPVVQLKPVRTKVLVILDESYDQDTAIRLESLGLIVTNSDDNKIHGTIPIDKVDDIMIDKDVLEVQYD